MISESYAAAAACSGDDEASAASSSATNAYGLTLEQEARYVASNVQYMRQLHDTSRYPADFEFELRLPIKFFIVDSYPGRDPKYKLRVLMKSEGSVCEALDSLLVKPAETEKWIIECNLALALTQLQGARSVVQDDKKFDEICKTLSPQGLALTDDSSLFIDNFLQKAPGPVVGGLCYIQQLPVGNADFFVHDEVIDAKHLSSLAQGFFYHFKHGQGDMFGLNMMISAMKQQPGSKDGVPQYIAFGYPDPISFTQAADELIKAMNVDMTGVDQELIRNKLVELLSMPQEGDDALQYVRNTFLRAIGSIKYNPSKIKLIKKAMAKQAVYLMPKFSRIFALAEQMKLKGKGKDAVQSPSVQAP